MGLRKLFFDWTQPALPAVVAALIERYQNSKGEIDLSNVITVFPGRQAGRRFLELLAEQSEDRAVPPRTLTVGTLPEFLYQPKRPFASPLTQKLAWAEALQSISRDKLQVVIPQPPADSDVDAWLNLGDLIQRQHRELATDKLNFSDVSVRGSTLDGFNEVERWQVLAEIQQSYLNRLDDLDLWDQQTARLFAIKYHECQTTSEIILIGTVDLNETLRTMLEQVAEAVTVIIHAPESLAECFEEFGNLRAAAWESREIEIDDSQIQLVDGPQDQASQVAVELAALNGERGSQEITICLPDERIVSHLSRILTECNVQTSWVIARTLPQTGPYRLLAVVAAYLEADRTDHLSELIRHPDFSKWIDEQGLPVDWLSIWDNYTAEHLPRRTSKIPGNGKAEKASRLLIEAVNQVLKPLKGAARPLADWVSNLREFLLDIYGALEFNSEIDSDRILLQASEIIHAACLEHGKVPEALAPVVTAPQAIQMTLDQVRGEFIPARPEQEAIHLSGWLDMPLDDAPVAIVTSMNEGFIPSAVNHDLFLPNRLRVHLGIEDNTRRYARDAYALAVVLNSREHVRLIAAKRDVRKEPLTPSRLFFATDPQTIARRVVNFFDEGEGNRPKPILVGRATSRDESDFTIPRPHSPVEPKRSFRVTEFKDYISSPYRYYLRHLLKLVPASDSMVELDPAGFGSLIHDVLQRFGTSRETRQTDPLPIERFLNAQLDQLVRERYGSDPLFPVHVQIEQIRHRLKIFSDWQANRARQGWEIRFTEIGFGKNIEFPLDDGTKITLRGRIDRIDFHPIRKEWVIFDYKTGDHASAPEKTHRQHHEWVDLQLPLYRHLAKPFGVTGTVRLGYITLPRTASEIGEKIADWSEVELLEADAKTREIASKVIRGEFWVELDHPVRWSQEYSGICQDGVFDREAVV